MKSIWNLKKKLCKSKSKLRPFWNMKAKIWEQANPFERQYQTFGKKIQYSCPGVKSWYPKRQTPTLWLQNDGWQNYFWHQFFWIIVVKLFFALTHNITELLVVNHSIRVFVQLKRNMINILSLWSLQPSKSYNPSSHH